MKKWRSIQGIRKKTAWPAPTAHPISTFMSQEAIDAKILSVCMGTLNGDGVKDKTGSEQVTINAQHSGTGWTALHCAVFHKHRELAIALLAAGADANMKDIHGRTSVYWGAYSSTTDILQLLLDGGGSANEPSNIGETPLMMLARHNVGDAAARLDMLLARPELDLDATFAGKTADDWALQIGLRTAAIAIATERVIRDRWNVFRATWVALAAASAR
jgi:ankyrin repeat protein